MSRLYRSAQGRVVDMEKLRLANEDTIAVGNMKVNARGDQLGPGGKVVKTRNQIMKEYYQLNTPVAKPQRPTNKPKPQRPTQERVMPVTEEPQMSGLDKEMMEWDQTENPEDRVEEKNKKVKK